ncbi:DUF4411 family protein [uncultured Helicobacter sp.]|uniref:DUF4411 family protein n=1 Tax=uncultured Helicobacter sp. TaxID=175537 RepID=UPI00261A8C4A|nr:DUF4411 family protein [uncultured Helicobacter sp.]
MNKYLLDTNFFLDSSLRYYQNDFFQDFWKWLRHSAQKPSIKTIKKVKEELNRKNDFISNFIKEMSKDFFIDETKYLENYAQVIQASQDMDFNPSAKEQFAQAYRADAWLLAVAQRDNFIVVSNEKMPDKKEKKNIKIPRMCDKLGIKCIDIFDFIKEQKLEFCIKNMPHILEYTLFDLK